MSVRVSRAFEEEHDDSWERMHDATSGDYIMYVLLLQQNYARVCVGRRLSKEMRFTTCTTRVLLQ